MNVMLHDIGCRIKQLAKELQSSLPERTYDFGVRFDELGNIMINIASRITDCEFE